LLNNVVSAKTFKAGVYLMEKKLSDLAKMNFEVVHLGMNAPDHEKALEAAQWFEALFGWPVRPGKDSIYAEPKLEIMAGGGRGTYGHIAVATDDIYAARAYLEGKGCAFAADSAKYDAQGNLIVIYLKDEVAGFAVHLLQR
jgi:2-dehydro-3-deoxyphosphogluconate aldolase/(4S)-4-hydroxy-2-oxoglutarate aldolase